MKTNVITFQKGGENMLKKTLKVDKGFTLIELVMVIVIIGILAVVAIPKYISLQTDANNASEKGTVGGVRAGISIWHARNLIDGGSGANSWPEVLDYADNTATPAKPFFVSVLDTPITTGWTRDGASYTGPNGIEYSYDTSDGSFETP